MEIAQNLAELANTHSLPLIILLTGFVASFGIFQTLGIRSPGVIGAPLLAVYGLQEFWIIPLVFFLTVLLWGLAEFLQQRRFLYGHKLFLILCMASVPLAFLTTGAAGLEVFGAGVAFILPAIFAYNAVTTERKGAMATSIAIVEIGALVGLGYLLIWVGV